MNELENMFFFVVWHYTPNYSVNQHGKQAGGRSQLGDTICRGDFFDAIYIEAHDSTHL